MQEPYFLRCRECGKKYGNRPQSFCEECFSPLEVSYDYEALSQTARRAALSNRAFNMWRYAELLPLPAGFTPTHAIGGTPLVRSRKLAAKWGVKDLYFKNDAVCFRVCRSRIAWWRRRWRRRASSGSRPWVARRRETWRTPWPPRAHNKGSIRPCSFPPTWNPLKF